MTLRELIIRLEEIAETCEGANEAPVQGYHEYEKVHYDFPILDVAASIRQSNLQCQYVVLIGPEKEL